MMLSIAMLFTLAACGGAPENASAPRAAPESGAEEEYIITRAASLPEEITTISGGILSGEKLLACCWEEADEAAREYYIAAIDLAGEGFGKWPLTQAATRIPLDIAPVALAGRRRIPSLRGRSWGFPAGIRIHSPCRAAALPLWPDALARRD